MNSEQSKSADKPSGWRLNPRDWHPRVEMRWRVPPDNSTQVPDLEQLWQCEQTGELWWRSVPIVVGWESSEP
jgi:hypothetical protein